MNNPDVLNYAAQVAAFYNHLVLNGVPAEHARDLTDRYMASISEAQLEAMRLRAQAPAGAADPLPVKKAANNGNGAN